MSSVVNKDLIYWLKGWNTYQMMIMMCVGVCVVSVCVCLCLCVCMCTYTYVYVCTLFVCMYVCVYNYGIISATPKGLVHNINCYLTQ